MGTAGVTKNWERKKVDRKSRFACWLRNLLMGDDDDDGGKVVGFLVELFIYAMLLVILLQ